MRLWKMDTISADLFPQEGNRIKTQNTTAFGQIEKQNVEKLEKHVRILPVKIDLIRAESCPNVSFSIPRVDFGQ